MILQAVELSHVGRFRGRVRLGPFSSGLNVLSAPNESGKSTLLHAAARALFDRHSAKGEEIKALQPAGTDLAPRVAVEFETGSGHFRIDKTFLQKPESQLHQLRSGAWELLADADAADQRVQKLLQSSLPGRGATKPEHWGLLGFLWARQGEPAAWPGLDDAEVGQRIRSRLARVELDPVIESLRDRLSVIADAVLTSGGRPKIGGPLRSAEEEIAVFDSELAGVADTRGKLEETHRVFLQSESEVVRLEKEHTDRAASAATLREQTLAAERLLLELDARRQALATATEKLAALTTDTDTLARLQQEQTSIQADLAKARDASTAAEHTLAELRARLDAAQSQLPEKETSLQSLRAHHQRQQSLLKLRQLLATADTLTRQVDKAAAASAEITSLENKYATLPTLTPARLRKMEEQFENIRTLRAQLQALGLTVELTPDHSATVSTDGAAASQIATEAQGRQPGNLKSQIRIDGGETHRLQSPSSLDLHLTGWGRVVIRSGSQEAQTAATDLAQAETSFNETLQQAGVSNLDAAREAIASRKELEAQIKSAKATLAPHLGEHDTIDALRAAAATATRRAETLATSLAPTTDEQAHSLTDLETTEATQSAAIPAAEKLLAELNKQLTRLRTEERNSVQRVQQETRRVNDRESRLRVLEAQIKDLGSRYPEGIDAAKTAAQLAFAQAEARALATEKELPPDFRKLPERNKRAAASLQQIANELQTRRTARDQAKGTLETLGGQGLYSRETALLERRAETVLRRDDNRARGWAARVARDLVEYRKQTATKAVLAPLENRLAAAFAELTGDTERQVFLDECLQISGIGRSRAEAHAFDQLSQGAKEQLLLCLRLAVAQELAADEPQILILDDVLVNTDSARQERILDVLVAQAERLQILILTCHPDRYRGIGQPITLTAAP